MSGPSEYAMVLAAFYGGIHFPIDNDTGLRLGRKVAALAPDHDVAEHEAFVLQ